MPAPSDADDARLEAREAVRQSQLLSSLLDDFAFVPPLPAAPEPATPPALLPPVSEEPAVPATPAFPALPPLFPSPASPALPDSPP